jgi:hypothetical protein
VILNTCIAATEMKCDVRIIQVDKSRYLSVFFKAHFFKARCGRNPPLRGLVPANHQTGPLTPHFKAGSWLSLLDYLDFPAPR